MDPSKTDKTSQKVYRSGKSSIFRVVFQKMSPHETFFLTPTTKIEPNVIDNNPYIQFTIKDFPGNYDLRESSPQDVAAIKNCGTLIYVIDAQP